MLVVILGAGASWDSVDLGLNPQAESRLSHRPPLARELFDPNRPNFNNAVEHIPQIIPVLNKLRRAARDEQALEDVLERLETEANDEYDVRHRHLLAVRVYLQWILRECGDAWRQAAQGNTHYDELVDEVERWRRRTGGRVTYVPFNYDTLLEQALALAYDWTPTSLDSYIERDDFWVLKLHGSVSWSRLVSIPGIPPTNYVRHLWERAGRYELGGFLLGSNGVGNYDNKAGLVPAIAVPIANKQAFECPDEHVLALRSAVSQATKVISVGWRGVERHFLDLWKDRNGELDWCVVAGSRAGAAETANNLHVGGLEARRIHLGTGGFGDFLGSGELRRFLDQRV